MLRGLWNTARGWRLLVGHLGIAGALRYERDRRAGARIDYALFLSEDELAKLGEHVVPAPWEKPDAPDG